MKARPARIAGRLVLLALALAGPCLAQNAGPGARTDQAARREAFPRIRRIQVPAASPEVWPEGNWHPWPLDDFNRQEAEARADSAPADAIEQADYSATLVDDVLQGGRLEWTVRRSAPHGGLIDLAPLDLAVARLEWADGGAEGHSRPVIWGTTPEGGRALWTGGGGKAIAGQWALRGRRLARSTEFELRLAPAEVSKITLQLPAGLVLTSSAGRVSKPAPALQQGWTIWKIELGATAACRLRITPAPLEDSRRPALLARCAWNFAVRPEVVRLLAEFNLEALESSVQTLAFRLDSDIQVTAVEYGGDNDVSWTLEAGPNGSRVVVHLPDPVSGPVPSVQIHGITQLKPTGLWALPRIRVEGAVESEGTMLLRLLPPFEAADVRMDGFRQVDVSASPSEGETLLLRQFRADGNVSLASAQPHVDAVCRAATLIQAERSEWSLTAQLDWSAGAGHAFSVACQVADDWEVFDVRQAARDSGGELSGWEVVATEPGRRVLKIDFLNALSPRRPQSVRVRARRLTAAGNEIRVPPLIPLDAAEVELISAVAADADLRPLLEPDEDVEIVTFDMLRPAVRSLEFLRPLLADQRGRAIIVRTSAPQASARLSIVPAGDRRNTGAVRGAVTGNDARPRDDALDASQIHRPVVVLSADLSAMLSCVAGGFDVYRADMKIAGLSPASGFRWRLPEGAELIAARLDDRRVIPERTGQALNIALTGQAENATTPDVHSMAIEYRVPAAEGHLATAQWLALPDFDHPVMRFRLNLALPPSIELADRPQGIDLVGFDDEHCWYRQLAGPLARSRGGAMFNPLLQKDWTDLFEKLTGRSASDQPRADARRDGQQPVRSPAELAMAGWRVWRGTAPALPERIRVVVCDSRQFGCLSWGVLLGCLLIGLSARRVRLARIRLCTVIAASVLLAGVVALPVVWAELAGSALVGIGLAVLLPTKILEPSRAAPRGEPGSVPPGSTQSFGPALASVFLLAGISTSLFAQVRDETQAAPAAGNLEREAPAVANILIPVDETGAPEGATPVCYVPEELLRRLQRGQRARGFPSYLVAAADYDAMLDEFEQVAITARYDVYVPAGADGVRLALPLTNSNLSGPDACLVDGRPQAVVLGPEGRGLIVEIPRDADVPDTKTPDASGNEQRTSGSAAGQGVRQHRVELRLHPAALDSGDTHLVTIGVPQVLGTHATFAPATPSVALSVTTSAESQPIAETDATSPGRVAVRVGAAAEIHFRWSSKGLARPPRAEVDATVSCIADVAPSMIHLKYHAAYRVVEGKVDRVVWTIPAGLVIQSVQAPLLSGWIVEPTGSGARRLILEFSRPHTEPFSAGVALVALRENGPLPDALPLADLSAASDDADPRVKIKLYQIAFRPPPDFGLAVTAAGLPPKTRTVDSFLAEWSAEGARPQQVFEVDRPWVLNVARQKLSDSLAARAESRGRFHRGQLDWTWIAELERPAVPPLQYRLQVDPRLRIRSVSVNEDGADRLLRWSPFGDSLVLFLSDKATHAQTVRIDATLPLAATTELELPRIRFNTAEPRAETLLLSRDVDVAVTIADDLPPDSPATPASDRSEILARLEVPPEGRFPRVRVEPLTAVVAAEAGAILERQSAGWKWTHAIDFQVTSGRARRFDVDVPEFWADRLTIRTEPLAQVLPRPARDGFVRMSFFPARNLDQRFRVTLSAPAELPPGETWRLPEIRLPEVKLNAAYLLLPHGVLRPATDTEAVPLSTDPLPGWLAAIPAEPGGPSTTDAWRIFGGTSPPEVEPLDEPASAAIVRLADLYVALPSAGTARGRAVFWFAGLPGAYLDFDWPEGTVPEAVLIDGMPATIPPLDGRQMRLALDGEPTARSIWIAWRDESAGLPETIGRTGLRAPWPAQLPVESCLVALDVSGATILNTDRPFITSDDAQRTILRRQATPESTGSNRPSLPESGAESQHLTIAAPAVGTGFEISRAIHLVNRRLTSALFPVLAALTLALAGWLTARLFSLLQQHEALAWLALGAVAWLWLSPVWLGPALSIYGCYRAFRTRLRPLPAATGAKAPAAA